MLLTTGFSQDDNSICLPEEQARALLEDGLLYKQCEEEKENITKIVILKDSIIVHQDSIIILIEQELELQELLINETKYFGIKKEWWYFILGGSFISLFNLGE